MQHLGRLIATTLVALLFAGHGLYLYRLPYLDRFDAWIYDARLLAAAPNTLDTQVVIIDIDEASLNAYGRWPWSRDITARLVTQLTQEQQVAALGFDMVFAEADSPHTDAALAKAIAQQPVVLGYYFTSDRSGHINGTLPSPVLSPETTQPPADFQVTSWTGYGSNLNAFMQAAPQAGFFNAISDADGLIRSAPLLAEFKGRYYESLALGLYRRARAQGGVLPRIWPLYSEMATLGGTTYPHLQGLRLLFDPQTPNSYEDLAIDGQVAMLIPYRGKGGNHGGSFQYISAKAVLEGQLLPAQLKGKVALLGSSTPTLEDLRATPMGATYPGVEVQANLVSALLNKTQLTQPDYALGFELLQLIVLGLLLAFLPRLSALGAMGLTLTTGLLLWFVHSYLFTHQRLVLPSASGFAFIICAYVVHSSHGFFIEGRRRQRLMQLFGSYVSPKWVERMARSQEHYSMQASHQVLTVMFCDMRGFTKLAGDLPPLALQALLNHIFNNLSTIIQQHGGTIDKYMGDCVMAFWGAPETQLNHAARAVACAQEMLASIAALNQNKSAAMPDINMGIGINTGLMCVGDMGSNIRRSYTVIGDAVNLASRLEGLCKQYNVALIVSEATRNAAMATATANDTWQWQSLGSATIEGSGTTLTIYTL